MTENLSRKERRLLKKLKKQYKPDEFFPEDIAPAPRVMPFLWITLGFVFIISVFSLVLGAHMWVGHSVWPRIVGWSITAIVGVVTFVYWARMRKFFKFSRRWLFLFPIMFLLSIVCSLIFVYFISIWQETSQLKYREQINKELIDVASAWKSGERWDATACQKIEQQQDNFVAQFNQTPRPPYMGEVLVLFSTLDVSYQAGCDPHWDTAIKHLTDKKPQWVNTSPSALRGFNNFVSAQHPNIKKGCQMELTRLNQENQAPLHSALQFLCDQVPQQKHWVPGEMTAQAQHLVQRVKRVEDLKKNSEQQ